MFSRKTSSDLEIKLSLTQFAEKIYALLLPLEK